MDKIYIIEDDQTIRNEIVQALKKWNFQADWVRDFQTIDYEIKQQSPDLIVMDITLPFYISNLILQTAYNKINQFKKRKSGGKT